MAHRRPDLPLHLDRLVRSYPDWIARAGDDNVILKNGTRLPISDHRWTNCRQSS
jgi:hypothetical protein